MTPPVARRAANRRMRLLRDACWLAATLFLPLPHARALSPATEATIREALPPLYDLEYAQARGRVRRLIEAEPENPYGTLFEAGALWWQADNEFEIFKDSPALESLFEEDVRLTLERGQALLDSSSSDTAKAQALFAMGIALGLRGQWHLLNDRWLRAYFDGRKAVKHLDNCLRHDPEFYDAYLGLGLFDYQADRLPAVLRLPALLLVSGDARRGLERMQLAMEKGRYASAQAAQYLTTIYLRDEKDPQKALEILRALRGKFPQSPYLQYLEAIATHRLGRFDESYPLIRNLIDKLAQDPQLLRRKLLTMVCGLWDGDCLAPGQPEAAQLWLTRALEREGQGASDRRTLLRLMRAATYDMTGRREEAVREYEAVLASPEFLNVQELAKRCLASACDREESLRQLKSMALTP
ncbi:MAG: hypothetical protein HY551_05780 [Elusimicrobia bacterium]|nr:hypothetical protein [Elusimicrobiota bacterium]